MSVMSPEKYMELVFLYKNSIGPGAVQSAKNTIWVIFCKKTKMDIVFLLVVPVQVWHNKQKHILLEGIGDIALFLFST